MSIQMHRGPGAVFLAYILLTCTSSCSSSAHPEVGQGHQSGRGRDGGSDDDASPGNTPNRDGGLQRGSDGGGSDEHDAGSDGGGGSILPLPCDESFVYQGVHGCVTTVADTQVKFFPLEEGREVDHLAVYLHQDSAWEWYSNDAFPTVVEWAASRGIMVVAPLAPSIDGGEPEYGALVHRT
jgi:hypothetical protein